MLQKTTLGRVGSNGVVVSCAEGADNGRAIIFQSACGELGLSVCVRDAEGRARRAELLYAASGQPGTRNQQCRMSNRLYGELSHFLSVPAADDELWLEWVLPADATTHCHMVARVHLNYINTEEGNSSITDAYEFRVQLFCYALPTVRFMVTRRGGSVVFLARMLRAVLRPAAHVAALAAVLGVRELHEELRALVAPVEMDGCVRGEWFTAEA